MIGDRIEETTTSTGTGTLSLAGASTGRRSFVAGIGSGKQAYYVIDDAASAWEIGIGTVTAGSPDTLSRTTIIASSNGGSAVNFAAGAKTVRVADVSELLGSIGHRLTYAGSGGSANAYTLTLAPAPRALVDGMRVAFKANHANTGASTLNVNALGAKALRKGDGTTALGSGDILANQIVVAVYDAGQDLFQVVSALGTVVAASETVAGTVELATAAETAAGADNTRAVHPAGAAATFHYQGKQTIWIPAVAMTARTTNGFTASTAESTANKVMQKTADFDPATQQFGQFWVRFPKSWNLGTVSFMPIWTATAGTPAQTAIMTLAGVGLRDDDAIDTAFGAAQSSSDALIALNDIHIGPESAAITIAGTLVAGANWVCFQLARDVATDTLTGALKLLGIVLIYTTNAKNDA
jgi:hypothetical protein